MNKNEIVYGPPLMPEPSSYEKGEEVRIFNDPNEFENYIKLNTEHQIIDFNVPASYDSVHINTLYSSLQNMFDDLPLLSHAIPMCAAAQKNYKIINGWSINEVQIKFLSGGSLEIEREGQKNRKFINLFSAGQTIKDVHCAWEITKNDKIVSCGSFYIPGHFDQLIEITDIEEDCCMTIICSDDTRWKSDFTFNISGNGRHVIPLFPNDIIMKKYWDDASKWERGKKSNNILHYCKTKNCTNTISLNIELCVNCKEKMKLSKWLKYKNYLDRNANIQNILDEFKTTQKNCNRWK